MFLDSCSDFVDLQFSISLDVPVLQSAFDVDVSLSASVDNSTCLISDLLPTDFCDLSHCASYFGHLDVRSDQQCPQDFLAAGGNGTSFYVPELPGVWLQVALLHSGGIIFASGFMCSPCCCLYRALV